MTNYITSTSPLHKDSLRHVAFSVSVGLNPGRSTDLGFTVRRRRHPVPRTVEKTELEEPT